MAFRNGRAVVQIKNQQTGQKTDYVLALFKIVKKRNDGSPWICEMLLETDTVHLQGGEEFMTAFVPAEMIGNGGNG